MLTAEALLDIHERAHRNLKDYLEHCRTLDPGALDRKVSETSEATVLLQLHHVIWFREVLDRRTRRRLQCGRRRASLSNH
jgi:hypothetical protein